MTSSDPSAFSFRNTKKAFSKTKNGSRRIHKQIAVDGSAAGGSSGKSIVRSEALQQGQGRCYLGNRGWMNGARSCWATRIVPSSA